MQVRLRFGLVARNPLRRSCASRARNAGEIASWPGRGQPSAEIVRVKGTKFRSDYVLDWSRATLCGDRACRGREMHVRLRFGLVALHFWRTLCGRIAALSTLGASEMQDVSYELLILETWSRFTFGGSLARNARFGDLALHFWRTSCTKRWFWRLGASLLEEVSYETLVLETWRFTLEDVSYETLVLETCGASLLEDVSYETLVLETWRFTFRLFWRLGVSLLEEVSYETLVLETWRFTFGGSLVRNARFGDLALHVLEELSCETLGLETWRITFWRSLALRPGQFVVHMHWREKAFRSWTQKWPVCSTKCSAGKELFGRSAMASL